MAKNKEKIERRDIFILKMLHNNARTPLSIIAKKLGITENAIRYRIQRMKEKNYFKGYSLSLSPICFGKHIQVVLSINVRPDSLSSSIRKLAEYKEFTKVYRSSGKYSIMCIGFFDDNEYFEDFLNRKMLIDIPVTEWEEHIVLKRYKNDEFNITMI